MIRKDLVDSVLRKVIAGKEEDLTQEVQKGPVQDNTSSPVYRMRYYYYEADPKNSIKFSNLKELLEEETTEKQSLIQKLKGGLSGIYCADYFAWNKLVVVTDQYNKELVAYEVDLNSDGTKKGTPKVSPEGAPVTVEQFEKDLTLFSPKNGDQSVLNLDTGSQSFYSGKKPEDKISERLLSRENLSAGKLPYSEFSKIFDEYRIYVKALRRLMLPNNEPPKAPEGTAKGEEWAHGEYPGGDYYFHRYIEPKPEKTEQNVGEEPAPEKEPEGEKAPSNLFRPVIDEPAKAPTMPKMASVWQVVRGFTERQAAYATVPSATSTQSTSTQSTSTQPSSTGKKPSIRTKQEIDQLKKLTKAKENLMGVQQESENMIN